MSQTLGKIQKFSPNFQLGKVLDYGIGLANIWELAGGSNYVTGIDCSKKSIEIARKVPAVEKGLWLDPDSDLQSMDSECPDNHYEVSLSANTLNYTSNAPEIIKWLARKTAPNGIMHFNITSMADIDQPQRTTFIPIAPPKIIRNIQAWLLKVSGGKIGHKSKLETWCFPDSVIDEIIAQLDWEKLHHFSRKSGFMIDSGHFANQNYFTLRKPETLTPEA